MRLRRPLPAVQGDTLHIVVVGDNRIGKEHTTQPKYQYHHSWRLGDILIWDNRCLIHSVNMDFPVGQRRIHQRILLAGAAPVS